MQKLTRRQSLAAVASVMPMLIVRLPEPEPKRVYSVSAGDRGQVTLNGVEVKAIAACPVDSWCICVSIENNIVKREKRYGKVEFSSCTN